MYHNNCRCANKFNDKIAVTHRIKTVRAHAFKTELLSNKLAVNRKASSGKRPRTERQLIDARANLRKAQPVTSHHLEISKQIMSKQNRLRPLQMRIAGNYDF